MWTRGPAATGTTAAAAAAAAAAAGEMTADPPSSTPLPKLTPQFCFSSVALRGAIAPLPPAHFFFAVVFAPFCLTSSYHIRFPPHIPERCRRLHHAKSQCARDALEAGFRPQFHRRPHTAVLLEPTDRSPSLPDLQGPGAVPFVAVAVGRPDVLRVRGHEPGPR